MESAQLPGPSAKKSPGLWEPRHPIYARLPQLHSIWCNESVQWGRTQV